VRLQALIAASFGVDRAVQATGALCIDQGAAAPAAGAQPMVGALQQRGDRGRVQARQRLEGRGHRDGDDVAQVDRLGGDVRGVDLVGDGGLVQGDGHRRVDERQAVLEGQFRR
jgi:hypothetical protein